MLGITNSKFLGKNSPVDSKRYKRKIPEKTGVGTTLQTPLFRDEIPVYLYRL